MDWFSSRMRATALPQRSATAVIRACPLAGRLVLVVKMTGRSVSPQERAKPLQRGISCQCGEFFARHFFDIGMSLGYTKDGRVAKNRVPRQLN
jgi:hypothetical protein